MNCKDRQHLNYWLNAGLSLNEVEKVDRVGLVGNVRFSERARDWFRFFHTWGAQRFAGIAGQKHDRAYAALGSEGYKRRIQRVNRLLNKITGG